MTDKKDSTQNNKSDKVMNEISQELGTNTVNRIQEIADETQRLKNTQYQNPQHKQISQEINCLANSARGQQMSSQQQLQSTLNQASTNLIDSARLETLYGNAQKLQQAAQLGISNLQINIEQYKTMIEQMEKDCHQQQVATDTQVVQSLHQAISSMAQAQNSLLQSQAVDKMFDSITKCQASLAQIEQINQQTK
ncbi:exonuclease SbcC [Tepidanaerobacter acetatoxydans]|uniref:exonuclease SbcC n=1 Tax=Tepidanaerobacter acetatoxydans TaxID=499229 RepID=UPI001BD454D6|nr:exonuclease SbcC [Tepidanaerobacter acetatoxydans]